MLSKYWLEAKCIHQALLGLLIKAKASASAGRLAAKV